MSNVAQQCLWDFSGDEPADVNILDIGIKCARWANCIKKHIGAFQGKDSELKWNSSHWWMSSCTGLPSSTFDSGRTARDSDRSAMVKRFVELRSREKVAVEAPRIQIESINPNKILFLALAGAAKGGKK